MSGLLYPQERGQTDDYQDTLESVEKGITSKIITKEVLGNYSTTHNYIKKEISYLMNILHLNLQKWKINTDSGIYYGLN